MSVMGISLGGYQPRLSTIKQYLCLKLRKIDACGPADRQSSGTPGMSRHYPCGSWPNNRANSARPLRIDMRRTIERLFEVVEANAACGVFSVLASFAMTGCLRFLWG
jgi:hypothetical protein